MHARNLIIALLIGAAPAPQAASFDCGKAATWVEKAICRDAGLSALDETMAERFRTAQESAADPTAMLTEQRAWLKRRNACRNTTCLHERYEARIQSLKASLAGTSDPSTPEVSEGRITDSGPSHSLSVLYPVFADPGLAEVNREVRRFVDSLVQPFRDELPNQAQADGDLEMPPWSLQVTYAPPYIAPHYIAIDFNGYDFRGGAHGMPIIAPLVLKRPSGQRLSSTDLFVPGSDWLGFLSDYCYDALKDRDFASADDDWLRSGTAPKTENYQWLFPGPKGLTVTFPPYMVAPYAAGPQSVLIPYARLSGRLSPELFTP
ncbi:DUF3298 domain-containing protein [Thiorhodococcus mannitoliphagus]|uniref:DUF3298 domain-containing protein n=1 Tax=Thiorhodococcus mannitoliphagus TaxID=329406 RepID=A0A6P1DVN0_9GAMM|nr:DUF3298 domain-containing protein [Thiorhodococcus mannitoliphagus]NEX21759.1 DUF3298 domain-containing protein [Thiorhodococcus mannitoliphagus]